MKKADVIAVLDEAIEQESKYAFILVDTLAGPQMISLLNDEFEAKKEFYEERFDDEGLHATYPNIALLAADHGGEEVNITLRQEYFSTADETAEVEE